MVAKSILCAFFIFFSVALSAQQYTVSGKVVNEEGAPIIGCAVALDQDYIEATDVNGIFRLQVSGGIHELWFRNIGFEFKKTMITVDSDTILNIQLVESSEQLDEMHVHHHKDITSDNATELGKEDLENTPHGNFADQLEKLPGLTTLNVGVGIGKPVIRGMSFNRVSVYDQGVQQQGQQWGADHGLEIDAFQVKRVEVVKGAQAIKYGSDGIAGVIKILPELPPQETGFFGDWTSGYFSNNHAFKNSLRLGYNNKHHFLSLRGTYNRYADFSVPDNQFEYQSYVLPIANNRLKNTGGEEWNFNAHYQWSKDHFIMRVNASHFNQTAGFFVGAVGQPQFYDLSDDQDYYSIELPNQQVKHTKANVELKWLHHNNDNTTLNFSYQLNDRSEFSFPHAHGYEVDENDSLALNMLLHTASLSFAHHLVFSPRWHLDLGLQSKYQVNERKGFEYLIPDYLFQSNGIYGHLNYNIDDNKVWEMGLRVDQGMAKTNGYQQEVTWNGVDSIWTRTPVSNRLFWNFLGATGVAFSWLKSELKINLGSAFRMPNPAELYANGVHHGTFRHEKGNPVLNPENGLQLDLSYTYHFEKWYFSFSPYSYYFFNYLYLKPGTSFSPLPDAGQIYQYSQTEAFFAGAETQLEWKPLDWLKLSTDWAYTYALNLQSGYNIPFTPPLQGNLRMIFYQERKGQMKKWSVEWHQHYSAAQKLTDVNEKETPDFTTSNININFLFDLKKIDLKVLAGVQNLWNTSYLKHLSRYRLLNIAEPGRNIFIQIQLAF